VVSFGPTRRVVPNQNLGRSADVQRRLTEAAGRAAEKTRVSVSVDAWPTRLFLRNPRGTVPCACCSTMADSSSTSEAGTTRVVLDGGQLDDVDGIESGYPLPKPAPGSTGDLPAVMESDDPTGGVGTSLQRLLIGNGRRCGICWGTGWIDGHRLWGGQRRVMCVVDAPGVAYVSGDVDVDRDSPTPTMIGPGEIVWSVRVNHADRQMDALRVRDGIDAAAGGYVLSCSVDGGVTFYDPRDVMSEPGPTLDMAMRIKAGTYFFRLTLAPRARVSHVELVSRSERLVNLQLPQLQQAASAELIAPMLVEDFELDPIVGYVERGSVFDVQPVNGVGSLWIVSDVTNKRTSDGFIFGVVGTARTVQPTEGIAAASMRDVLRGGLMDRGSSTRGLEATGGGVSPGDRAIAAPDESVAAARRGSQQRLGGGNNTSRTVIVLNTGRDDD
jgi:hypothetical protein